MFLVITANETQQRTQAHGIFECDYTPCHPEVAGLIEWWNGFLKTPLWMATPELGPYPHFSQNHFLQSQDPQVQESKGQKWDSFSHQRPTSGSFASWTHDLGLWSSQRFWFRVRNASPRRPSCGSTKLKIKIATYFLMQLVSANQQAKNGVMVLAGTLDPDK